MGVIVSNTNVGLAFQSVSIGEATDCQETTNISLASVAMVVYIMALEILLEVVVDQLMI